ncbi:uncharacterized protein [Nicotiana tomentosiformis]|uniref:uncharacterized protein n=1 Tax=Nicotiana tomentosiformis TaxID=4098 RepID=UPI00388CA99E
MEVNVVGNYNFNAMGQKNPIFSWSSLGGTANEWKQINARFQGQGAPDERLNAYGPAIKEFGTGLRNLEKHVGQIAIVLSERIPVDKKKKGIKAAEKKKEETSRREESNESENIPALPFPQKFYREKLDKQFEKYLGMLRQVNVNLPFTEVLSQMPAYAKFLKEILIKKRRIEETSVVKLTEHCSAILPKKLPQKCEDSWSFTIPCSLGTLNFDKSLCDSGASINLMPFYRKLENELGEIRPAPISLQLIDQTTIISEGMVEDILVRVDKFVFPVDFIVVNIEENKEVPFI